MARFGLPSVVGASAAGAYGMSQFKENGMTGVWSMLPGVGFGSSGGGSSEVSALQNELRRLTGMVGDMARNNQRPTVVTVGSSRSGWTFLVVPAVVGGTVLYVYCRVTGSSVLDFFYVSRSSLSAFRSTIQDGMTKMWEEMKKQKEEIFKVVGNLGQKQDKLQDSQTELMAKQDQMDERLRRVDDTCYQLDSKANTTINHVEKLDTRLQDVHTGVQAANQGIYMLVSAVSEVTQKIGLHNSRTAQALHRFVSNGPAWATGASSALPEAPAAGGAPAVLEAGGQLPQLPAPPAAAASGPSLTGGVATPGGLRGLMSSSASLRVPDTQASNGSGLFTRAATLAHVPASTRDTSSSTASCQIEEVTENGGVAATPTKPVVAGLGVLRF